MIVLDTNVLSAVMRAEPDPGVVRWLDRQPAESMWTTSVTVFEILFGIAILAIGRRRRQLEVAWAEALTKDLEGRVLAFDDHAASAAARFAAQGRLSGRPVDIRDVQIAGIVAARRATLATRNRRNFESLDIPLIDPWS